MFACVKGAEYRRFQPAERKGFASWQVENASVRYHQIAYPPLRLGYAALFLNDPIECELYELPPIPRHGLIDNSELIKTPEKPAAVEGFLEENPHLRPVVDEAGQKLLEYFGASTQIKYRVRRSPEEPEEPETLFIVASIRMPSSKAIAILDELDEDWWFHQFERTDGRVQITFEHRKT